MKTATTWAPVFEYLMGFSTFYPSIAAWCSKVREDLPSGRRSVLAFRSSEGAIAGLAITKNEEFSKLCHISITDNARSDGCGVSLVRAAAFEMISSGARRIHVTTSEEVTVEYGSFFERCGFSRYNTRTGRYRPGVDELEWVASRESLSTRLSLRATRLTPRFAVSSPSPLSRVERLRWMAGTGEYDWVPMRLATWEGPSSDGPSVP